MKNLIFFGLSLISFLPALAQHKDTIDVQTRDLHIGRLQTGKISYLLYAKRTKESIATRITLITFQVQSQLYHQIPVIAVSQQWNADTTTHTCYTLFDAKTFATVLHDTYWKRLGYHMKFDFDAKTVDFTKVNASVTIPDSIKAATIEDFEQSFKSFNLNWHADMLLYSLLDYQQGRVFRINYFDPGFGAPETVLYTVTNSESLTDRNGSKIECWVLNHFNDGRSVDKGYERFWVSKKTNEVLKMEDFGGVGQGYRYKLKLGISGDE